MSEETRNKTTNSVLLQGSILAGASLLVRIIGLVYRIPLTRIIGDDAMGYYSTAFEFYNLALLLSSYSLPLAVSKLVSARQIQERYKDARRVFIVALTFGFVVGSIASLLVYFGADLYGQFNHTPLVAIPLRVLAPTIFVFSVMGVVRGYFQGYNNMLPTALSQVVEQIVNAVVSVGAAIWMMNKYAGTPEQSAYGAAGGTLGTFLGACAAAVTLFILLLFRKKHPVEGAKETASENYRYILWMLIITVIPVVISQTVYQLSGTIDVTIFHRTLDAKHIAEETRNTWWGIYSAKYKLLTNVPVAIASAMGTAIVPSLVAERVRGHADRINQKVASAIKFNMIIAFPCAFGLISLGGPILQMLYGDTRALGAKMMAVGGIAVVFFALSTVTNGVLQGINHMFVPVWHSLIALVLHCVALFLLLRNTEIGALALVICNVFFALIVCVLNGLSIRRYLNYKQEWKTVFVIPFIASALMGAVAYGGYRVLYKVLAGLIPGHVTLTNLVACVSMIGLSVIVYFVLLIAMKGVSQAEIREMPKGRVLLRLLIKLHLMKAE